MTQKELKSVKGVRRAMKKTVLKQMGTEPQGPGRMENGPQDLDRTSQGVKALPLQET